jgi:hypothetical protein
MTWEVSDKEFEGAVKAGPQKQYDYLVGHCAGWEQVWGLAVDGTDWAQVEEEGGEILFAVWPHARYAEACWRNHWEHREPTPIDIHAFVDELIPQLLEAGTDVAVFPLPDGRYTPVSPRRLRSDLENALDQYE